jgi:translocator protein
MLQAHAVVAATLIVLGVNWLANALPLNGRNTGELSALYPNAFTPAGYVFAIWGLIYAGTLGYAAWQWQCARRGDRRLVPLAAPYLAACLANVAWILLWHWLQVGASLFAMGGLLLALAVAWRRVRRIAPAGPGERAFVHGTFSLYLGWICVATFANLAAWLVASGTRPFGLTLDALAVAFVLVAALLFVGLVWRTRWLVPGLVYVWAAVGIAGRDGQPAAVVTAAWAGVAVVSLVLAWTAARRRR